jgi:hypothetical protein
MGGHVLLLAGLAFYARYVMLDAAGLLTVREGKRVGGKSSRSDRPQAKRTRAGAVEKTKTDTKRGRDRPESPPGEESTIALPTKPRTSAKSQRKALRAVGTGGAGGRAETEEPYDDEHDVPTNRGHMSKSERKRLRKLQQQRRRAA